MIVDNKVESFSTFEIVEGALSGPTPFLTLNPGKLYFVELYLVFGIWFDGTARNLSIKDDANDDDHPIEKLIIPASLIPLNQQVQSLVPILWNGTDTSSQNQNGRLRWFLHFASDTAPTHGRVRIISRVMSFELEEGESFSIQNKEFRIITDEGFPYKALSYVSPRTILTSKGLQDPDYDIPPKIGLNPAIIHNMPVTP